ncbi:PSB34 [Auxenochlorella protothecoides x Auxenochlorella symbiontica]
MATMNASGLSQARTLPIGARPFVPHLGSPLPVSAPNAAWGVSKGTFQPAPPSARSVSVGASTKEGKDRQLDFGNNKNAGIGYTEKDSAGQANIYPVEPRQYVSGSRQDGGRSSGTFNFAVGGGALAIAAVAAGLLVLANAPQPTSPNVFSGRRSLAEYTTKFKTDLARDDPAANQSPGLNP